MAKLLRLRRGTTTQHGSFTGAEGEVTVDTDKDTLVVHDNATAGGRPMLREDLNNMPASGVTAGTYGSSSAIPAITVDAKGRVTSATTSAIDSTSISNGTSNVSVAASGDITATRAGSTKLTVNSTGIDVIGTVTTDGLVSDGDVTVQAATGTLIVKDTDNDGVAAVQRILGNDSQNNSDWWVGQVGTTNNYVYLTNSNNAPLIFQTNNSERCYVTSDGHFAPWTNNTYDIGSPTNQWRHGYFDGTVNCDGLQCDGSATINATDGYLFIIDSDSTGNPARNAIFGRGSDGSNDWYVGQTSANNVDIRLFNDNNGSIEFGTNAGVKAVLQNDGHFRPDANNSFDLGTSSYRWRNVYTNDLNLSNEGSTNDVDGTWGSWTIQEGEDDLFLLNRRNGKKYKFNLSEVN